MNIANTNSDDAVMAELGRRATHARIQRRLTQAQLAAEAGVSKRTVERLENGMPTHVANLIRILRALGRMEDLEHLLTETPVNPIEYLKRRKVPRSRVRHPKAGPPPANATEPLHKARRASGWVWGDSR